jgi:hypothetical protein
MWRPAILLFGAAVLACRTGRDATPVPLGSQQGHQALVIEPLAGNYWCSIDDGYQYPPFACKIRQVDKSTQLELVKLGGSQRFRGQVHAVGDGFTFDGTFYCPYGDCTQDLHGLFRAEASGAYRGEFRDATFSVQLVRASSALGGASYGGASYGGASYGGANYGNYAPSGRRNRRP